MLKIIKEISKKAQVDNIQDATIHSRNPDGTYNIIMRTGAIKKSAINSTDMTFKRNERVNISMVTGNKETAKIIGRGSKKNTGEKIIYV